MQSRIRRDVVYEAQRDALIPEAVKFANRMWGRCQKVSQNPDVYNAKWSKTFHERMKRLVEEAGI